jgi:poly-gamma-glutamate synthesis protein (capsule biosynthesis protein)
MDLAEAAAPAVLNVGGLSIAFLGAADRRSGTRQFAGAGQWGVAPLDVGRLAEQIRDLRSQVDHVLVSLHWGEERFLIPSPAQIDQARTLAGAGASMVIGHHPHVLQGMERHNAAPILYSLGNFIADDVHFTDGDVLSWDRTARTGCIVLADLGQQGVADVRLVPTYDSGQTVELDESEFGSRRLQRTGRALARGITLRRYRREHLWVKTVKPAMAYLRWRRLKNLRMRQIRNAIGQIRRSRKAD